MNASLVAIDAALERLAAISVDGRHVERQVALLAALHMRLKDLLKGHSLLNKEVQRVFMHCECTQSPRELSLQSLLVLSKCVRYNKDFLLRLPYLAHHCVLLLLDGCHHYGGL